MELFSLPNVHYAGIADIQDYSKVYAITPEQVKAYLSAHDKVVVYDYTPWCKSAHCVNPTLLAGMCRTKGADLLVISNVYDDIFLAVNPEFPILMIDADALHTKWRGKYIERFYQPLIGRSQKDIDYALYHYFEKGAYVCSFENAKEINTVVK